MNSQEHLEALFLSGQKKNIQLAFSLLESQADLTAPTFIAALVRLYPWLIALETWDPINNVTEEQGMVTHLLFLEALALFHKYIPTLPPEIGQLYHLRSLYLNTVQLQHLPPEIGQLQHLEQLKLNNNQLTALPESIGQLSRLKELNLWGNNLQQLPNSIGQLAQLQQLHLLHNQLTTLPASLQQCTQLHTLALAFNPLRELPTWLLDLEGLKCLQVGERFRETEVVQTLQARGVVVQLL